MIELFKEIFLLDIALFILRRILWTKLRIRVKEFFITIMIIRTMVALIKAMRTYAFSKSKNSAKNSPQKDEGTPISNHPYLRVVK